MSSRAPLASYGLLSEHDAAAWLGVSPTKLRTLNIKRRRLGTRRLYDMRDLQEFRDSLPYEDEPEEEDTCDAAFG